MQIDYATYPDLFFYGQFISIGLVAIAQFFIGMKRGLPKTVWHFIGTFVIYALFIFVIGFVHLTDYIKVEHLEKIVTLINNPQVDQYYNYVVEAGAVPVVLSIVDLALKIVLFTVLSGFIRGLVQFLVFGLSWHVAIKPMTKNMNKHRFLAGMLGFVKGAALGAIILFPSLVLLDTIVGDGIQTDDPDLSEMATAISLANEKNLVRYANEMKIKGEGAANFLFDYMFSSKVNDDEKVTWRAELAWIADGAVAALPEVNKVINGQKIENFTIEDLQRFEGLFTKFSESNFLNNLVKPGIKVGLTIYADSENSFLTKEEVLELYEKIDSTDIKLSDDFYKVYLAAHNFLSIQDLNQWQGTFSDYQRALTFNQEQQTLFIEGLRHLTSLSLLELGDVAAEVALFTSEVKEAIKWVETEEEKLELLRGIKDKINNYSGSLVQKTLEQVVDLLDSTIYDFPGIDLDNDGKSDLDFVGFISNIANMTVVLNNNDNYHNWFKNTLTQVSDFEVFDLFMEEITLTTYALLMNTEAGWSDDEMDALKTLIDTNFATNEDLRRELSWIADVYKEVANLEIGYALSAKESFTVILDDVLSTQDGRNQFRVTINKILDGQTISKLTEDMSDVLLKKYLTEPLALVEPIQQATELESFKFRHEIDSVLNVILSIYEEGLLLSDVINDDQDIVTALLPVIIEFVKDEDNQDMVLNSQIMYAFIDYNLKNLDVLQMPETIYESTGEYSGWIKKDELSAVFSILGGLVEEMDNQGIDVSELLGGAEAGLVTKLLPVIKAYASIDENRELLLSSDILYNTLSVELKKLDAIEIPDEALDSNTPYVGWIEKEELDKLLRAIIIIDLEIPEEGASLDLSSITGEKLSEVIAVESIILRRVITTQLVNANVLNIPDDAFISDQLLDLKQEELEALANLLVTLDIDLGALGEGNDANNLLDDISVSKLTETEYEDSLIIKSFITFGITEGLGEVHELAFDKDYPDVLSNDEIGQLFNVLKQLDSTGEMSVKELMDELDPEKLTFKQVNSIINNSDSIIIRSLLSSNLLDVEMISTLDLKDNVYHTHNGQIVDDLISYDEMKKLISSFNVLAANESDLILDLVDKLDVNLITLGKVEDMINQKSSIINTLLSSKIIELDVIDMHPNALDEDNQIKQQDLYDMMHALTITLGEEKTIDDLSTLSDTLAIKDLRNLITVESIILNYFISNMIIENIGEEHDRVLAHDIEDPLLLSQLEFDAIFDGLASLDASENESTPIVDVAKGLDKLKLSQVTNLIASGSHILRARVSYEMITNLGEEKVHPNAIDENKDINQEDLDDLFTALLVLGADTEVSKLGEKLTDDLNIGTIKSMRLSNSIIFEGLLSNIIKDAMVELDVVIREDAYVNDQLLGKEGFGLLTSTELSKLLNSIEELQSSPDQALMDVVSNMNVSDITPTTLTNVANLESIIVYRLLTNTITKANISIPTNAFQTEDMLDLTKAELVNLSNALTNFGMTSLDVNTLEPEKTSLSMLIDVIDANSLIINRKVSEALYTANLATTESHVGMEGNDIQTEEIINLLEAFIAFGINDISSKDQLTGAQILTKAKSLDREEFEMYIGYEAPYDPLKEDLGMTIFKDFLIEKLDDQFTNPLQPEENIRVRNRQEIINLISF